MSGAARGARSTGGGVQGGAATRATRRGRGVVRMGWARRLALRHPVQLDVRARRGRAGGLLVPRDKALGPGTGGPGTGAPSLWWPFWPWSWSLCSLRRSSAVGRCFACTRWAAGVASQPAVAAHAAAKGVPAPGTGPAFSRVFGVFASFSKTQRAKTRPHVRSLCARAASSFRVFEFSSFSKTSLFMLCIASAEPVARA